MVGIKKKYDRNYFESPVSFLVPFFSEVPRSQRNRNRLKEVLKYKGGGNLLEIGHGKGGFLELAKDYFDPEGIDISKHAVSLARRSLGERVRVGDIREAELNPNFYDVVAVFNLLEHLEDPRLAIRKIYDSLKQGGLLIGSVPNNSGLIGGLSTQLINFADRTHISTFPPNYWYRSFSEIGFKDINFYGEIPIGANRSLYARGIYWRWVSANLMFEGRK